MKVKLISYPPDLVKIQAVKAVCTATGMGLKESKQVCDQMDAHMNPIVIIPTNDQRDFEALMNQHGFDFEIQISNSDPNDFLAMLNDYPENMTVGDLIDSVRVTLKLFGK